MMNLYPDMKLTDTVREECGKCLGTGYYTASSRVTWRANGKSGTLCFDCNGAGYRLVTVKTLRARARRAARLEAGRADREAAELEANQKCEADEAERAARIAAQRQAEHDAAEDVVTGRVVITGEIVSTRMEESTFGYRRHTTYKMLVRDDRGFKVWGSIPNDLMNSLFDRWYADVTDAGYSVRDYGEGYWATTVKGTRVTLTATVTASDNDPKFGFASRPVKGSILD